MTGHDSWQPIPSVKAEGLEASFLVKIVENVLRRDRVFDDPHWDRVFADPMFVPSLSRTIVEEIRERFEFKLKGPR